jgi:hypothetical protein
MADIPECGARLLFVGARSRRQWAQEPNDALQNLLNRSMLERTQRPHQQRLIGGEETAGSRKTRVPQSSRCEVTAIDNDGMIVGERVTRDLAQDPIPHSGIGETKRRSQLRLRKIREGKRHKHYFSD